MHKLSTHTCTLYICSLTQSSVKALVLLQPNFPQHSNAHDNYLFQWFLYLYTQPALFPVNSLLLQEPLVYEGLPLHLMRVDVFSLAAVRNQPQLVRNGLSYHLAKGINNI